MNVDAMNVKYLTPRWRLDQHPLWQIAYCRVNPNISPLTNAIFNVGTSAVVPSVYDDAYAQITVPEVNFHYRHLMQAAKEIVQVGQTSVAAFKRTIMAFNALCIDSKEPVPVESSIEAVPSGFASIRAPIAKSVKKCGRRSNDQTRKSVSSTNSAFNQEGKTLQNL